MLANKSTPITQLLLLALLLPLAWRVAMYQLSPFNFVDDKYGTGRFLLFCLLLYSYYHPTSQNSLLSSTLHILLIFGAYGLTFYLIDWAVHFALDKELKIAYLNNFYDKNITAETEAELKSINSDYSISPKKDMVQSQLIRLFSMKAYLKDIGIDLIKYAIFSFFLAKALREKSIKK